MAFGLPSMSYLGYPVALPCPGHAGLGFREVRRQDAELVLDHLRALEPDDRQLRFCGGMSDEALAAHVAGFWERPGFGLAAFDGPLFAGAFHRPGRIRGFAELVTSGSSAELGLSVDRDHRRAGIGTYLVQAAASLLAPRGVREIRALTLARNTAMIRFGQSCGARIEADGGDVEIVFPVKELHRAYLARRAAQVLTEQRWAGPL